VMSRRVLQASIRSMPDSGALKIVTRLSDAFGTKFFTGGFFGRPHSLGLPQSGAA
jgi:hypothetical protein